MDYVILYEEFKLECIDEFERMHGGIPLGINAIELFDTVYDDEVNGFERWHDSFGKRMVEIVKRKLNSESK